jgi:hypothetical protein
MSNTLGLAIWSLRGNCDSRLGLFGFDIMILLRNILCTINRLDMPSLGLHSLLSLYSVDGALVLNPRTRLCTATHSTRSDIKLIHLSRRPSILAGVKNALVI